MDQPLCRLPKKYVMVRIVYFIFTIRAMVKPRDRLKVKDTTAVSKAGAGIEP